MYIYPLYNKTALVCISQIVYKAVFRSKGVLPIQSILDFYYHIFVSFVFKGYYKLNKHL